MQRNLKVCVINPNYYRSSGVTVVIKRLFEGSAKLNIDWHFITCDLGNKLETEFPAWLNSEKLLHLKILSNNPLLAILNLCKLLVFLESNNIDIVHVHHRRVAITIGWLLYLLNIPLIYTAHLTYGKSSIFKYTPIKRYLAISQSVKENIIATVGNKGIDMVYNPAPFEESPINIDKSRQNKVCCIARLEEVKNHIYLIESWKKAFGDRKDVTLTLIGEGSLKNKLLDTIKNLNLENSVFIKKYTSAIREEILSSSFMVLTSKVEGLPLVVLEAAGLGVPTLLTDADGSRDCVPPESILPNKISLEDSTAYSNALTDWMSNFNSIKLEGLRFHSYWKDRASPNAFATHHQKIYLENARR